MKDMLDDIPDDELRKKLQDYSESPDDAVWDNIASGMKERMPLSERLRAYEEQPDEVLWSSVSIGVAMERSMLWLERTGKFAAVIAFLMLLYPFTQKSEIKTTVNSQNQNLSELSPGKKDNHIDVSENNPKAKQGGKTEVVKPMLGDNVRIDVPPDQNWQASKSRKEIDLVSRTPIVLAEAEEKSKERIEPNQLNETGGVQPGSDTIMARYVTKVVEDSHDSNMQSKDSAAVITELKPTQKTLREEPIVEQKEESEKKEKKHRQAAIYLLAMPTFGYQQISPLKDDNILIESIEKVSAFSSKRLGLRLEAGIERPLTTKFSYHAGVLYYQRKQTINYIFRSTGNAKVENIDQNVYQISLPTDTASFEYELKNVGVIVGLNYTTKIHRFINKVGIAGELQKGLNRPTREMDTGQRYYIFGDLYYRISYSVSRRVQVMFQPTLNYALQLDSRVDAPFYVKPYGLGLNFGAYFHF